MRQHAIQAPPMNMSVEYVLSQNPAAGSHWLEDFNEDPAEYWTHRLGNLLLLNSRKNSQASNYDFAKKRMTYFKTKSGVAMSALTTQVDGEDNWTPAVVETRQKELKGILSEAWAL